MKKGTMVYISIKACCFEIWCTYLLLKNIIKIPFKPSGHIS